MIISLRPQTMCLVLDVEPRVSQPDQILVQPEQPQNLALALARLDPGLEQNPLDKEAVMMRLINPKKSKSLMSFRATTRES